MPVSTSLPAHTLNSPLNTEDEHILRQVLANTQQLIAVIRKAKELGLDVSQHEQRAGMHAAFATRCLEQFFPLSMTPPPEPDDPSAL